MENHADRIALGARLKEKREYSGFSQEDVAAYLKISRSAVSLMESGGRKVDVLELKQLARLYQCSIEGLTQDDQSEPDLDSIKMVARAAADLSPEDRSEVLKFAQFLKSRKPGEA